MKNAKLLSYFLILGMLLLACSGDDLLEKNTYTRYVTAKVNGKRFLFPLIYRSGAYSNTLHQNNFLRLHMGSIPNTIGVEIIIHDLDLTTLKLPAIIPNKNFTIALQDSSLSLPNNEKCKKLNLSCYYVANDSSTEVELIITKFTGDIVEGKFSGNFHTFGFFYFIVNDLTDKVKVTDGYFISDYTRF